MSYFKVCSFIESKLTTKDRKEIPDEDYGIPSQRRYPLNDREHVFAAIRMFNHVDKAHEAELARNIKKKMIEYNIPKDVVGENNRLRQYL